MYELARYLYSENEKIYFALIIYFIHHILFPLKIFMADIVTINCNIASNILK